MRDSFFLAFSYLRFHWARTLVLVLSISLILFIPMGLNQLVRQGAESLTSRAVETPLLVGTRGSQTEMCMAALYFKETDVGAVPYSELEQVRLDNLARAIPLHLRYNVHGHRIVGTTTEYFDFRGLKLTAGRPMALLGECVLGSKTAQRLGVMTGDHVISSPSGAFDIAGSYPLKMEVVGVLAANGTADDEAVFADLKTTWVISGLAHGHEDLSAETPDSLLLRRDENEVVASPAVLSFTEITAENRNSFHFHGDESNFPVDVIIVVPHDRKGSVILQGRFEDRSDDIQMAVPEKVIGDLVNTLFSVRNLFLLGAVVLGLATLFIIILVFDLSRRLRKKELLTMRKIGASMGYIRQLLGWEVGMILLSSLLLALFYGWCLQQFGPELLEFLVT